MNTKNIFFGVIGAIILIILLTGGWLLSAYNGFLSTEEEVDRSWLILEDQYQRRADLIPNLVSTVKWYAAHEEEVLAEITVAKSQWGAAATQESKMEATGSMDSAISRLLLVAENYPNLKVDENFLAIQTQLKGTEERIVVERIYYNEQANSYNKQIQQMPTIVANIFGFDEKPYLEKHKL